MNAMDIAKTVAGGLFLLIAPGLAWSYFFFARKRIDWIERLAISFGLSLALVPMAVFWLNWLAHMKITVLTVSATVLGLIAIAGGAKVVRDKLWPTPSDDKGEIAGDQSA